MDIKPIQTRYRGHLFRSRIEARWAVFFDALGIPFEYEKEGFELKTGRYLPDFWMPLHECWVEIKGKEPTETEMSLATELAEATQNSVFVFHGAISLPDSTTSPAATPAYAATAHGYDTDYCWCQCPSCGKFGIKFDGRSDRLPCKEPYCCAMARLMKQQCEKHPVHPGGCLRTGGNCDKGYTSDSADLVAAYQKAMSARFEFGESGAT